MSFNHINQQNIHIQQLKFQKNNKLTYTLNADKKINKNYIWTFLHQKIDVLLLC